MGNGQSGIQLGKQHLVQHLRRPQTAHQASQGGGAKGAAHGTAHLRGDADAVAIVVSHQHRLHTVAIGQAPQVFHRPILPGLLFAHHLGRRDLIAGLQLLPQVLGQVGHLLKGDRSPVQPCINLPGPEGRLAQRRHGAPELLQGHGFDVLSHGRLPILQMKNPSVSNFPGSSVTIPTDSSGIPPGSSSGMRKKSG